MPGHRIHRLDLAAVALGRASIEHDTAGGDCRLHVVGEDEVVGALRAEDDVAPTPRRLACDQRLVPRLEAATQHTAVDAVVAQQPPGARRSARAVVVERDQRAGA